MRFVFRRVVVLAMLSGVYATRSASEQKASKANATNESGQPKPFRLFNPDTMAKPAAGYSQVAEVKGGKIVYIAGQVASDRSGNLVGKGDFRAQLQQVFENLKAAVEASGGHFGDVIKLNYYCSAAVDPTQYAIVREVRDKYVNTANPPTSTFIVAARLRQPEWMIEIEAVAVVK